MYVLPKWDGMTEDAIAEHNATVAAANHVVDPIPDAIMAINEWLHWYYDTGDVIECQCALIETMYDYCPREGRVW